MSRGKGRDSARAGGARPGRRPGRGRAVVALGLALFVLVGASVVWRRSVAIARARTLRALAARQAQLVTERATLEGAVRLAAARGRVGTVAESRLGMRVPSDTQVVFVSRAAASAGPNAGAGAPAATR